MMEDLSKDSIEDVRASLALVLFEVIKVCGKDVSLLHFKKLVFNLLNDDSSLVIESMLEKIDVIYGILSVDKSFVN
jgi:hypothetical protein